MWSVKREGFFYDQLLWVFFAAASASLKKSLHAILSFSVLLSLMLRIFICLYLYLSSIYLLFLLLSKNHYMHLSLSLFLSRFCYVYLSVCIFIYSSFLCFLCFKCSTSLKIITCNSLFLCSYLASAVYNHLSVSLSILPFSAFSV